MALKDLAIELGQFEHDLKLINQNDISSIPNALYYFLPVPMGEPYASPWQTHPATLHLNSPAEKNQQIFDQVVAILKHDQKPFFLPTQPDQQTDTHAILVHGVNLSAESGLNLLVSVQPEVFQTGSVQVYP